MELIKRLPILYLHIVLSCISFPCYAQTTVQNNVTFPYYFLDRDLNANPAALNEWIYPEDKKHQINNAYQEIGWLATQTTPMWLGRFRDGSPALELMSDKVVITQSKFYGFLGTSKLGFEENENTKISSLQKYGNMLSRIDLFFCSAELYQAEVLFKEAKNVEVLVMPFCPRFSCSEISIPRSVKKLVIYNDSITKEFYDKVSKQLEELVLWGCVANEYSFVSSPPATSFNSITLLNCSNNVSKLVASYEYPLLKKIAINDHHFASVRNVSKTNLFPRLESYDYYVNLGDASNALMAKDKVKRCVRMAQSTAKHLGIAKGVSVQVLACE